METMVRKNGTNAAIQAHILSDERMRELGFTDRREDTWYFCKMRNVNRLRVSFNVSINKNDPDDLRIDVLDEEWLQPYDYQRILTHYPSNRYAPVVKKWVDKLMTKLVDAGVLSNWQVGDYV